MGKFEFWVANIGGKMAIVFKMLILFTNATRENI